MELKPNKKITPRAINLVKIAAAVASAKSLPVSESRYAKLNWDAPKPLGIKLAMPIPREIIQHANMDNAGASRTARTRKK